MPKPSVSVFMVCFSLASLPTSSPQTLVPRAPVQLLKPVEERLKSVSAKYFATSAKVLL